MTWVLSHSIKLSHSCLRPSCDNVISCDNLHVTLPTLQQLISVSFCIKLSTNRLGETVTGQISVTGANSVSDVCFFQWQWDTKKFLLLFFSHSSLPMKVKLYLLQHNLKSLFKWICYL